VRVRSSRRPGWSLPQLTKRWVIPCKEREERNWEDAVRVSDMVVDEERRKTKEGMGYDGTLICDNLCPSLILVADLSKSKVWADERHNIKRALPCGIHTLSA